MSYIRITLQGPGYRYVTNTHNGRVYPRGKPREPKRERTPEEMDRQNARNRALQVRLLILGNFKDGWHVTLTYAKEKRPPDALEAKKELRRFLDRAGRRFKKAGYEFKWIAVTEIGSHGAVHHHLIVEDLQGFSQKVIRECWPYGKYFSPMYEDGEYESLSEYLVKKESKEDVPGCKVSHSRNLIMPKKTRERKKGVTWLPEPRVPKGWELIKDSLHNGTNIFTGLPCQSYLLVEIKHARKDIHIFNDTEYQTGSRRSEVHIRDGDWRKRGYTERQGGF